MAAARHTALTSGASKSMAARLGVMPVRRLARIAVKLSAAATETYAGLTEESYTCLGLAVCFEKLDGGKLAERLVIEPLSASSLECMAAGARTCFKIATGVKFGDAMRRNRAALPADFQGGVFCEAYEVRLEAAARTWGRPHAQDNLMDIVPLGKARSQWNFSLEDKRVLNMANLVSDDDNIKQDLSIDVYGRKKKEEAAAALAAEKAAVAEATQALKEKEEDDLDQLLSL